MRARYRRGRGGRTIFPLEILLGIEDGFTPAAASRIGQQFTVCGSSQGRAREMIADQMGTRIGTEKLRRPIATLAGGMQPLGQDARVARLTELINQAHKDGQKAVLSVSLVATGGYSAALPRCESSTVTRSRAARMLKKRSGTFVVIIVFWVMRR